MNIAGKKLSNGDLTVGVGLIVGLIALFLPWYSYSYNTGSIAGVSSGFSSSGSVGGLNYWTGWFFFLFVLIGLALILLRLFAPATAVPALPINDSMTYIVCGAVMAVAALLWLLIGAPASFSGPGYSEGVSFGLFVGLVCGVAVAVGGYLKRSDPQPATKPLSSYQTPSSAPPPPPPPA
jgi:preprotein translocase subunit SecG